MLAETFQNGNIGTARTGVRISGAVPVSEPLSSTSVVGSGLGYEPVKGTAITMTGDANLSVVSDPPESTAVGVPDTGTGSQTEPAYSYNQVAAPLTNTLNAVQSAQIPGWVWLVGLGVIVWLWLD